MAAPKFPTIKVDQTRSTIHKFEDLMKASKTPSGQVKLDTLRSQIEDAPVSMEERQVFWAALDVLEEHFQRTGRSGGCGGLRNSPPVKLTKGEVTTIIGALSTAQKRVKTADKDTSNTLNATETSKLVAKEDMAGEFVGAAVDPKLSQYRRDLRVWNATIERLASKIEERAALDDRIMFVADYHCATPLGAKAVAWAYRLEAVKGYLGDTWDMAADLTEAESSVLSLVPLTKKDATRENHLSDTEIKKFLDTKDLNAYIKKTQAEIKSKLGGFTYAGYLEGKE